MFRTAARNYRSSLAACLAAVLCVSAGPSATKPSFSLHRDVDALVVHDIRNLSSAGNAGCEM
ncbi:MAG TPA: hypothetical protein VEZ11_10905, partial [Thermoanaerobaculia bacterium]|nr:hypothetical protein [Thermoanaerobaculia bacterium]